MQRERGEAGEGKGYGTMRFQLFIQAKKQIEKSIKEKFFCEAIAICESVISDRLESRASFLTGKNVGFKVLGRLINKLLTIETDSEMRLILEELNNWRESRNKALHELVKVQRGLTNPDWGQRITQIGKDAEFGYELCCWLYWRVGELNPKSPDRVFDSPKIREKYKVESKSI